MTTLQTAPNPILSEPPPAEAKAPAQAEPFIPRPPADFAESGLDPSIIESLIIKYLAAVGSATGGKVAEALCLPNGPVIKYLAELKQQQIVVYVGTAHVDDFACTLTDAGRERARRCMLESMYIGPAPVPLERYIAAVEAQTITGVCPHEADLRRAFSDLLITDEMFEILGPAINSGRGLFLYGPPGDGKTSIAERVTRCFGDTIYIPKCIIVDGLIIKLFDAAHHDVIQPKRGSVLKKTPIDERWVKIIRPTFVVGGELTMDGLEVRYDPVSKTCEAPVQMKSNCGTLVIDDFGRQRMAPVELLNRWIVPLEKRYDFLALPTGKKISIPFDQLIIFSTNLEPRDLCDDAFLRRIPYKINITDPSEADFRRLFTFVGPTFGFTFDAEAMAAIDYLVDKHYKAVQRPFRCCQPRDLLMQVRNRCLYINQPLKLTPELFDYAVSVYFTIM